MKQNAIQMHSYLKLKGNFLSVILQFLVKTSYKGFLFYFISILVCLLTFFNNNNLKIPQQLYFVEGSTSSLVV